MKLGQLQEDISKAYLPLSVDLSNGFKSITLEIDQNKFTHYEVVLKEQENYL